MATVETTTPVPENERSLNSPVENEELGGEHEKAGDEFLGKEETELNVPTNGEGEKTGGENKSTEKSGSPTFGERIPNGSVVDHNIGPSNLTHKKRKRTSLAEARTNCLKPHSKVGKNKIPDLNIDLSDDSRPRPKRRTLFKKGRTNRRRQKGKIRLTEEEINSFEIADDGIEDDYDSEWEVEENTGTIQETKTTTEEVSEIPKETEKGEVEATLDIGLKIGIDLTGKETLLKKVIQEDQVDARIQ
ncbi:hypothetical protein HanIR_Chr07g0316431 [Helianthus annuus]|nr:hypothetical protein HanIR_Chr07g0316431 [Helianthus annuus]